MTGKSETERPTGYGISAVSRLTGISVHTLRMWERRYEAVVAQRASNGRRFYTPKDVEKLGLLKSLTDRGSTISRVAGLTLEQLRERLKDFDKLRAMPVPDSVRLAAYGDFLPHTLTALDELQTLEIVAADTDAKRFKADIRRLKPDVLALEIPVAEMGTIELVRELRRLSGAQRCVVIYSFGRRHDIDKLRDAGVTILRSPVTVDEVVQAVHRTFTDTSTPRRGARAEKRGAEDASTAMEETVAGDIPPRRFSQSELVRLASASSTVKCECPRHLADLVKTLTAFEVYSEDCENKNTEDAALHAYLHATAARSRALFEAALEKVARAEGLIG